MEVIQSATSYRLQQLMQDASSPNEYASEITFHIAQMVCSPDNRGEPLFLRTSLSLYNGTSLFLREKVSTKSVLDALSNQIHHMGMFPFGFSSIAKIICAWESYMSLGTYRIEPLLSVMIKRSLYQEQFRVVR